MMKIAKIYPRDIIAFFTLIACFILMFFGINHVVSGIAIAIIAFYFSKRLYEERNPNGDLNEKIKKVELGLGILKPQPVHIYRPNKKQVEKEFKKTKEALKFQSSHPSSDLI